MEQLAWDDAKGCPVLRGALVFGFFAAVASLDRARKAAGLGRLRVGGIGIRLACSRQTRLSLLRVGLGATFAALHALRLALGGCGTAVGGLFARRGVLAGRRFATARLGRLDGPFVRTFDPLAWLVCALHSLASTCRLGASISTGWLGTQANVVGR